MTFNVVLVVPEIPQNTGNIIRLCANTGAQLHLVEPLGFELSEKALRRAHLDYEHLVDVTVHESFDSFLKCVNSTRVFVTTSGGPTRYDRADYRDGDSVVFGSESRGLSNDILTKFPAERTLGIPMVSANRSINISNAVSIVIYEMWRQQQFVDGNPPDIQDREYFS